MKKLFLVIATCCVLLSCEKEEVVRNVEVDQAGEAVLKSDILPLPKNMSANGKGTIETGGGTWPSAIISPIIFVPQGSSIDAYQIKQIELALENVRFWYQKQLPNKDLKWGKLLMMNGQKTADYYLQNNNIWAEAPQEIEAEFGWNPWSTSNNVNHVTLLLGRDLLGWAGGNGNANGNGLAILGLESLIELGKVSHEWWGTQEMWHGTAIHELGHALTLPHSNDPQSIMSFHGEYKSKYLTVEEKSQVESTMAAGAKGPMPMVRWSFDSQVNNVIEDETANDVSLYLQNSAILTLGLIENAGSFNGIASRATTISNECNVNNELTLSVWVNPATLKGAQTIVNKWYAPDSYIMTVRDGLYEFALRFNDGSSAVINTPARANEWAHVAAVYSGDSIAMYVDGILKAGKYIPGKTLSQSSRPVSVGNHPSWNAFSGQVDMVTIYDRALPKNKIFTSY